MSCSSYEVWLIGLSCLELMAFIIPNIWQVSYTFPITWRLLTLEGKCFPVSLPWKWHIIDLLRTQLFLSKEKETDGCSNKSLTCSHEELHILVRWPPVHLFQVTKQLGRCIWESWLWGGVFQYSHLALLFFTQINSSANAANSSSPWLQPCYLHGFVGWTYWFAS